MYIYAKSFIMADQTHPAGYLAIDDQGRFGDWQADWPADAKPQDIIDYGDFILGPGLVDVHIHGYLGHDVMDNEPAGILAMSQALLTCGVTSWLPTTLTASFADLKAVCQTIAGCQDQVTRAKILGIFLEGPFFTPTHAGAQETQYMLAPRLDYLAAWQEAAQGLVKKIALAPEYPGAVAFIRQANQMGIQVAQAHSNATYDQAREAELAGAKTYIHTYNGMRGLHHREPGILGAALTSDAAYLEMIADGHHVHPAAIKLALQAAGPDRLVLISDCMRAGGMPEGLSSLGGYQVMVKDGQAKIVGRDNLAGSILKLSQAIENLVAWGLAPLDQAVRMAATNPAASIGLADQVGVVKPGLAADFIILNDQGQLQATYLAGQLAYQVD
ncbi:N-acetylglucosamine-6-phosphate deacetylase [Aerococcus urinaehominis]|uniref:N-acetylglucosamine-6-phosphate deacetylase n=1 Tax=Aerococcus urinaehominis TaxID=128944 RepID=A0A0X8FMB0_9LACT|nr:N-acetylglucosamine-6-phosphate deacetylase [Aerococcus urinaehominis]AMB99948.1 N-acetylglucosamine-6-phosphate deacetylase [Aerococcus urinaehominis]SDM42233.1 N-acetylglucosamine-6-phosphate deacetylase [Aerococcus urinaehominis]